MKVSELFSTATNIHHLRHPNSAKDLDKLSLSERILGIGLFALSGLVTLGIAPIYYLVTAYKKIRTNPECASSKKAEQISRTVFDKNKSKAAEPLFKAVEGGDLEALKSALLGKGLSVNSFDEEGYPLLVQAVRYKNIEVVKFLLDQPDVDINISRFRFGASVRYTALHGAAEIGDQEIIPLLLQKGIDPNIVDAYGRAPIHYAINGRSLAVFKALIADPRVDIQVKDTQEGGYTPLLFAVERSCFDMVEEFIKTERDLHFEDKDFYGNNIFHLLFTNGSPVIKGKKGRNLFKLILETCPEGIREKLLKETNKEGNTPYELSQEALKWFRKNVEEDEKLKKRCDELELLFEGLKPH